MARALGRADDADDAKSRPGVEGGRRGLRKYCEDCNVRRRLQAEHRPIIGQARSAFFEGMSPPASTLVGVSVLAAPEWLIEIEAVAVVD